MTSFIFWVGLKLMKNQARFAKKSLGQNFLTSLEVRDKIMAEAGNLKGKKVLEIGPGLGFLTEALLKAQADLTAIELDERAFNILNHKFKNQALFRLLNQDVLQSDFDALFGNDAYFVVANIPYHITNPIIRKLLEKTHNKPEFTLLMVQKEVAEKICDPVTPSTKELRTDTGLGQPFGAPLRGILQTSPKKLKSKRSLLSIAVEVYAVAEYCFTVSREYFEPAPKVDSAIIKLTLRPTPLITKSQQPDFFTVVNAGFSEKRKKIGNVLGKFFGLPVDSLFGDIDANRRAETLSIEEWVLITENFKKLK